MNYAPSDHSPTLGVRATLFSAFLMKKLSILLLAAVAVTSAACLDVTATTDPPDVIVTLNPAGFGSNRCVVASPDPASVRAGQAIAFHNNTGQTHTIVAEGSNTPWTTVDPGETSGSIEFSFASTRRYYVQSCGASSTNLHTVVITVN